MIERQTQDALNLLYSIRQGIYGARNTINVLCIDGKPRLKPKIFSYKQIRAAKSIRAKISAFEKQHTALMADCTDIAKKAGLLDADY